MLYLVMDNRVYGMTKGQPSPTTEADWDSDIVPGGLGLRPLNPMAVAIAAGATFIARGFSGRSHELADLMAAGIGWPGFSFLEVLSPCMAFRSERFEWKERVHAAFHTVENDRAAAYAGLLADDGFGLGILFKDYRAPAPAASPTTASLAEIEGEFAVCR